MSNMVKIIAGLMGGSVASGAPSVSSADTLRSFLGVLQKHKVSELDTARVYNDGKSEETLGLIPDVARAFTIATKVPGFTPGSLTPDNISSNCNASLQALQQDQIGLYYFHGPDRDTPLEASCNAIHDLHRAGKLASFGLSNYRADEVRTIHELCTRHGWPAPAVYQGMYNGLARGGETQLFPTLRELGIAFYAYSPLAGGYFSKTTAQLRAPADGGRMQRMRVFADMFVNETSLALHERLQAVCEREGVEMKAAALRWMMHHSILGEEDGVILGASSEEQMEENLRACEAGPLPDSLVGMFEEVWQTWSENGTNGPRMFYSV